MEKRNKIPAFVKKLLKIIQDPKFKEIISWLSDGTGFQITNVSSFTEVVLPIYFKHRNIASFVRQLNMHGFNRTKDSEQHAYFHPKFQRNNHTGMKYIQRKISHPKPVDDHHESSMSHELITSMARVEKQKSNWQLMCNKLLIENEELKLSNQQLTDQIEKYTALQKSLQTNFCSYGYALSQQPVFGYNPYLFHSNSACTESSDSSQRKEAAGSFNFYENSSNAEIQKSYQILKGFSAFRPEEINEHNEGSSI